MRRILAMLVLLSAVSCGSHNASPAAPTSSTLTRAINVSGSLNFGQMTVGDVRNDGIITITNNGNATLTITGISEPCGSFYALSWSSGTISAGASQTITVRFAPTAVQNCTGVVSVNGDQTSGTNTIAVTVNVVAGYSTVLAGRWRGTLGYDSIITLTEATSNPTTSDLAGTFDSINKQGTVSGSVNNTGLVILTITVQGYAPFTFTGQADDAGNTMSGQVNGSGFYRFACILKRV